MIKTLFLASSLEYLRLEFGFLSGELWKYVNRNQNGPGRYSDFLSICRTSETGDAYRIGILRFLDYVNRWKIAKNHYPTTAEFAQYEKLAARYLEEDRDTTADLIGFVSLMNKSGIYRFRCPLKADINTVTILGQKLWHHIGKYSLNLILI